MVEVRRVEGPGDHAAKQRGKGPKGLMQQPFSFSELSVLEQALSGGLQEVVQGISEKFYPGEQPIKGAPHSKRNKGGSLLLPVIVLLLVIPSVLLWLAYRMGYQRGKVEGEDEFKSSF